MYISILMLLQVTELLLFSYTITIQNLACTIILALLIKFVSSSKAFCPLFMNKDRLKFEQMNNKELHIP